MRITLTIPAQCEDCPFFVKEINRCQYYKTPLPVNVNLKVLKDPRCEDLCRKAKEFNDESKNPS